MTKFTTQEDCSSALRQRLCTTTGDELAMLISEDALILAELASIDLKANALRLAGQIFSRVSPSFRYFISPQIFSTSLNRRWVVRDDDLDLLGELAQGVSSTGGVGAVTFFLFGVAVAPSAILAAVVSCFIFFRKLRRNGGDVSSLQFAVLRCLRSDPNGRSIDELEAGLEWAGTKATRPEIDQVLLELQKFRLRGGKVVPLVNSDATGKWSAIGI